MVHGFVARMRSLWEGLRQGSAVEQQMEDEFRLHLELRAADLVRAGIAPDLALRQARLEFGSTEKYKDEGRASRGLHRFDALRVSWLDVKLGFRMLARYPGLTIVGGLAMAFAIWVGAAAFELATQVIRPTLPLPAGGRIVAIQQWDAATSEVEPHVARDFATWRDEVRSVTDLGAYRALERNLIIGEGRGEPVGVAEISASAFRLTRVPPLLGRVLGDADERPGAAPVVVIGYDAWLERFGGEPNVIGRTIRLAAAPATIVGVMPKGYAFPVSHSFWVPLRLDASSYAPREGPEIRVFGRLAPGVTLEDAQAELSALGQRMAVDAKDTYEHLRPQLLPFARSIVNLTAGRVVFVLSFNLPLLMLLALICGNVALLMFARAATRESEILVRTALGAGRSRIVMQLFAEALVLGSVAAAVGLAAAGLGLRWAMGVIEAEFLHGGRLPFWFRDTLSPTTILYAAVLTVLCAIICGVVPALKVTRGVGARLKQVTAGGGGLRFGGVWTAVIVVQVAVTVAFPAVAFFVRRDAAQLRSADVGFPSHEYLSARLEMDREVSLGTDAGGSGDGRGVGSDSAFRARFQHACRELARRLAADPAVARVAFADRLPRMYHPHRLIAVDEGGAAPLNPNWPEGYRVSAASVDPDFFDAVGAPILIGHPFRSADFQLAPRPADSPQKLGARGGPVIVNKSFVQLVLGGRNPIGRRIRYVSFEESRTPADQSGPWYEIVGVVRDLGMAVGAEETPDPKVAGIYHPVASGGVYPAHVAVHVKGDPAAFAARLPAIATAVDPTMRLYAIARLDRVNASELQFLGFWFQLVLIVSSIALVLSLAGIYAVMSFAVSRRTREIGVRVALGANRRRVVAAVFARPLAQLALGVAAGSALVGVLLRGVMGPLSVTQGAAVLAYAALMTAVCLLACLVPTRRALRVEPTEALKADG